MPNMPPAAPDPVTERAVLGATVWTRTSSPSYTMSSLLGHLLRKAHTGRTYAPDCAVVGRVRPALNPQTTANVKRSRVAAWLSVCSEIPFEPVPTFGQVSGVSKVASSTQKNNALRGDLCPYVVEVLDRTSLGRWQTGYRYTSKEITNTDRVR